MIRPGPRFDSVAVRLPRMRGDDPFNQTGENNYTQFAPHARG